MDISDIFVTQSNFLIGMVPFKFRAFTHTPVRYMDEYFNDNMKPNESNRYYHLGSQDTHYLLVIRVIMEPVFVYASRFRTTPTTAMQLEGG